MTGSYSPDFYDRIAAGSLESAKIVVPEILKRFPAASVVDFGCGTGAWLSQFVQHGVSDVLGLDFGEVAPEQLEVKPHQFQTCDLSKTVRLERRFDIAMSLEVAEHLPEDAASVFVGNLVRHADVVIFSAAIPGQMGNGHINCQYPSYWAEIFSHHMFLCFDPLRPVIWDNAVIPFWYRQNMMVFVNRKVIDTYASTCAQQADWIDLVHPDMLTHTRTHFRTRLDEVHAQYKHRIRDAKSEAWDKAHAFYNKNEPST